MLSTGLEPGTAVVKETSLSTAPTQIESNKFSE